MPSTAIKISAEAKEILDRDSKKWSRSISSQATFYIKIGHWVQNNEPELASKALENGNGSKKRTRKTS
jgi:hypothetical protein